MPRSASGQLRDASFAELTDRMEPVSVGHAKNGFAFYCLHDLQFRYHEHPVCPAVHFPRRRAPVLRLFALGERQKQLEVMQNGQQGTSFLEPFKRLVHRRSPLTF